MKPETGRRELRESDSRAICKEIGLHLAPWHKIASVVLFVGCFAPIVATRFSSHRWLLGWLQVGVYLYFLLYISGCVQGIKKSVKSKNAGLLKAYFAGTAWMAIWLIVSIVYWPKVDGFLTRAAHLK